MSGIAGFFSQTPTLVAQQAREIKRLQSHLLAIADHHEEERDKAEANHCDAAARYHEERRNAALFPLTCPEAMGTPRLLEVDL